MSYPRLIALILLATPLLARGDALGDLRATLGNLQSDQTLRARVEITIRRSGGENGNPKKAVGNSSVIVESGGRGLRLSWSAEQVSQSRKAAAEKSAHPDAARSDVATLNALDTDDALNLLDAAEPLRRGLEGAVLLQDKADTYKGKPARLLVIRPDLRMPEEGRKALKENEASLKLWLDSAGQPIAMNRDLRLRFSKFFLSYRVHDEEVREFQVASGRLVVTRSQHDNTGSGLGHTEASHTTTTVSLLSTGG
ncbi:MAG: hypothetical protein ACR2G0_11370 [Chthoniobacterales bacterium]